jgi:hypothetical protein
VVTGQVLGGISLPKKKGKKKVPLSFKKKKL